MKQSIKNHLRTCANYLLFGVIGIIIVLIIGKGDELIAIVFSSPVVGFVGLVAGITIGYIASHIRTTVKANEVIHQLKAKLALSKKTEKELRQENKNLRHELYNFQMQIIQADNEKVVGRRDSIMAEISNFPVNTSCANLQFVEGEADMSTHDTDLQEDSSDDES